MNGDEAVPPNFLSGRGQEMGPWEIPMELSAKRFCGGAIRFLRRPLRGAGRRRFLPAVVFAERLSVGKPLHIRKEANFL